MRPEERWRQLAGAFTVAAFAVPLLGGAAAGMFGLHPRLLSYLFAACALLARVQVGGPPRLTREAARVTLLMALFGALVLVQFPWGQPLLVPDAEVSVYTYPGYKLTRTLAITFVPVTLAMLMGPIAGSAAFRQGARLATLACAALGLTQVWGMHDLIAGGSWREWNEFTEVAEFSTISLSFLFFMGFCAAADAWAERPTVRSSVIAAVALALAATAVFLLAQRTASGLILMAAAAFGLRGLRASYAVATAVVAALGLGGYLLLAGSGSDPAVGLSGVDAQWLRFSSLLSNDDASVGARMTMWDFCAEGTWQRPLGHGVGSFFADYRAMRYPHNVFFEALYEEGVFGGAFVAALAIVTLSVAWRVVRGQGTELYVACLLGGFAYVNKTSDLSQVGYWWFWLYLAMARRAAAPRGAAAPARAPLLAR